MLRGEGIMSLLLAAEMLASGGQGREAMQESLTAALKPDSPLLSAAVAVKLAPTDAAIAAALCRALLLRIPPADVAGSENSVRQMFVNLLLHSHRQASALDWRCACSRH